MCTQESISNVAPLCANAFSFVLSPGAQTQTHCFVGSAGRVCRCVTHMCCFLGQAADPCLLIVVYSLHTQGFRCLHGVHPRGQNQPSSRNTHTLEREKQWEGTVVFLSSC